jgi:sodium transport system ATP-binding protein
VDKPLSVETIAKFGSGGEVNTIEVRDLTKDFGGKRGASVKAIDGVSFACASGEIFGLLGPNGAGKTTTLRIISTLIEPDAGSARVAGFDVTKQPEEVRKNIGMVSTDIALYSRMTPKEIMRFVGTLSHFPKEKLDARIEEVISILKMGPFANTYCEKLSSGMRQRASIARAIVHDPPIIILDEPTSTLDVAAIRDVHLFMLDAKARGKTILFSTHIMSEAQKLCDRIAIIDGGVIRAIGTLEELRSQTGADELEHVFLSLTNGGGEDAI